MKNVENSKSPINFPQLNLNNIKLQLYTDANFNNLPDGDRQTGQIIFLTDGKSKTCQLYWNSSKNQKSSKINHSSRGIVSFRRVWCSYIKKLVSELLFHDGKRLNIIAYTDNWSIYDAVHTLKQTLEKRLPVDISPIREMVKRNEINITWIEKTKEISDILTKAWASPNIKSGVLSSSKMIELWTN